MGRGSKEGGGGIEVDPITHNPWGESERYHIKSSHSPLIKPVCVFVCVWSSWFPSHHFLGWHLNLTWSQHARSLTSPGSFPQHGKNYKWQPSGTTECHVHSIHWLHLRVMRLMITPMCTQITDYPIVYSDYWYFDKAQITDVRSDCDSKVNLFRGQTPAKVRC